MKLNLKIEINIEYDEKTDTNVTRVIYDQNKSFIEVLTGLELSKKSIENQVENILISKGGVTESEYNKIMTDSIKDHLNHDKIVNEDDKNSTCKLESINDLVVQIWMELERLEHVLNFSCFYKFDKSKESQYRTIGFDLGDYYFEIRCENSDYKILQWNRMYSFTDKGEELNFKRTQNLLSSLKIIDNEKTNK